MGIFSINADRALIHPQHLADFGSFQPSPRVCCIFPKWEFCNSLLIDALSTPSRRRGIYRFFPNGNFRYRASGHALRMRKQELRRPAALANQNKGGNLGGNPTLSAKLPKGSAIDTRKEAAKFAMIGERTLDAVRIIKDAADRGEVSQDTFNVGKDYAKQAQTVLNWSPV